jgi:hypothetical protein
MSIETTTKSLPQLTFRIEELGPELAKDYLARNAPGNRTTRTQRVAMYAADMAAGRWLLNAQPITFSARGALLDGQHRLRAVLESGATVPMVIAEGVPDEAYPTIDAAMGKRLEDVAPEWARGDRYAAYATNAMRIGTSETRRRRYRLTRQEQCDWMEKYEGDLEFALGLFHRQPYALRKAAVIGTVARAHRYLSAETLERFVTILYSGITDERWQSSVIRLRDLLLGASAHSFYGANTQLIRNVEAALIAFAEQRDVGGRLEPVGAEQFPLSEDNDDGAWEGAA